MKKKGFISGIPHKFLNVLNSIIIVFSVHFGNLWGILEKTHSYHSGTSNYYYSKLVSIFFNCCCFLQLIDRNTSRKTNSVKLKVNFIIIKWKLYKDDSSFYINTCIIEDFIRTNCIESLLFASAWHCFSITSVIARSHRLLYELDSVNQFDRCQLVGLKIESTATTSIHIS